MLAFPFPSVKAFQLSGIQRKLLATKCAAFDVCLNSLGELDQGRALDFFLEPDEQSAKRLKTVQESIFAAFPSPPNGAWSVKAEVADEGQRNGKRKGKGKGKGKWLCPAPACMSFNSAVEVVCSMCLVPKPEEPTQPPEFVPRLFVARHQKPRSLSPVRSGYGLGNVFPGCGDNTGYGGSTNGYGDT